MLSFIVFDFMLYIHMEVRLFQALVVGAAGIEKDSPPFVRVSRTTDGLDSLNNTLGRDECGDAGVDKSVSYTCNASPTIQTLGDY